jgi:hypothetical protein
MLLMFSAIRAACLALAAIALSACVTTATTGVDSELASRPVSRLVAYVAGPGRLASSIQSSINIEARKRGLLADNALNLLPPTRRYTDADIRQALADRGIDGVLIINVGEASVPRQYAGTIFQGRSPVSSATMAAVTSVNGYPHPTTFTARLLEPSTARNLWNGIGDVDTSGLFSADDGTGAASAVAAIFDELQQNGIIAPPS